jgi:hypothetical protein
LYLLGGFCIADGELFIPSFQSSKPEVNGFFKVSHMAASGLASNDDEKLMFATPECVRFWTELDDRWHGLDSQVNVVGLVVEGPPGIGKSVGAWAWVCCQSMHFKKSGLWIHVDDFVFPSCVYLGPEGCKSLIIYSNEVIDTMKSASVDFLVFDGYKSTLKNKDALKYIFPRKTKRLGVVISSLAGGIMPDQFGKFSPFIGFWEHGPWLLENYVAACANTDFFESVKNNFDPYDDDVIGDPSSEEVQIATCRAQVEEKFYYAGASARWMFANTVHSVQAHVARYVDQVKNYENFLNEGHGIQSSESSNHLLMRYQGINGPETFFVSQYALKMLLHASGGKSDLRRAYALAKQHNNPAFLGWVVEFDFVEQLSESCANSAKVINLYNNLKSNVFWKVSSVKSFDPHSPFEEPWLLNQFRRPIKWNQGGYDAVCLLKAGGKIVLHFILVTRGRTHKMKMKFFASLAAKVSAEYPTEHIGVEISLILPRFQGSKFMMKSTPKIVQNGLLTRFSVGCNARYWPEQNEELEISTLYFDADFADRRGRGFVSWLEGLLHGRRGGADPVRV